MEKGAKHVASVSYFLLEKERASLDPTGVTRQGAEQQILRALGWCKPQP